VPQLSHSRFLAFSFLRSTFFFFFLAGGKTQNLKTSLGWEFESSWFYRMPTGYIGICRDENVWQILKK